LAHEILYSRLPSERSVEAWAIGKWSECPDVDTRVRFTDRTSIGVWLRTFPLQDLRRVAARYVDGAPISRAVDAEVVDRLAALIASGYIQVCPASSKDPRDPGLKRVGREDAILPQLRVTAKEFSFEGERLRVVKADEWQALRWNNDGRYQVVPQDAAQALLKKLSDWPAVSAEEKSALSQAVPLVPDTRRQNVTAGILLLRIVPRSSTVAKAEEPAITPSQLARALLKEDLHWIEIELVDDEEQPVAGETYKLELPDGTIRKGKLDKNGRAYEGDIVVAGQCRVCFPEIDAHEWRPL
jgi:hypothetical protein